MTQLLVRPYGHRPLEVIRHKAWQELQELQSACRDMRHHCILYNVYHQRPQELNAHMRTCHASLVDHVFFPKQPRSPRLKLVCLHVDFANESSRRHICVQCSPSQRFFFVNLYDPGDARHQQMVLTCEICQEEFEDDSALHRHLSAVHRLAYEDRRPERDMMGGDPVQ